MKLSDIETTGKTGKVGNKSRTCYKTRKGNILAVILEKLDKNLDKMQPIQNYKNATLSVEHTGMWRFSWYNTNPATGELERVRKTLDINRIEDLRQRRAKANLPDRFLHENP